MAEGESRVKRSWPLVLKVLSPPVRRIHATVGTEIYIPYDASFVTGMLISDCLFADVLVKPSHKHLIVSMYERIPRINVN